MGGSQHGGEHGDQGAIGEGAAGAEKRGLVQRRTATSTALELVLLELNVHHLLDEHLGALLVSNSRGSCLVTLLDPLRLGVLRLLLGGALQLALVLLEIPQQFRKTL